MHGRASLTSKATQLVAHGTSSKVRYCFYPWERLTTERRKQESIGKVQMSSQPFSHSQLEPVIGRDIWLTPRRLTARAHSPAACGGLKPDSVRATYEHGVLAIHIAKDEEAKEHTITVQVKQAATVK
jgi:hypothetical protein